MEHEAEIPEEGMVDGQPQRRRKFTIQSSFGQARERRSRKSRPCDTCRKRKTACVITDKPPCAFCKSRNISCISSGVIQNDTSETSLDSPMEASTSPFSATTGPTPPSQPAVSPGGLMRPPLATTPIKYESPSASGSIGPPDSRSSADSQGIPRTVSTHTVGTTEGMGVWPTNGPGRIHTLEDNLNKTANFMGDTAEQDTYILDSFRYMIVSEKDEIDADYLQVYPGSSKRNDPPVHFLLLENEVPEHTLRPKLESSDAIERTVYPYSANLVRLFFKYVHPVYPVVSKGRFLRLFATNKEKLPASLRGAVYAVACMFWSRDPTLKGPCPFEQHELQSRAQISLTAEFNNTNLANLQSCLLLLHMTPPWIDTVESPVMWVIASQALACAQMSGLHKDCDDWNIEPWEKKLRKRLWWAVYAADCWASICHGNPPHISPTSFSTTSLNMDDMRFDEDIPEDLKDYLDPADTVFDEALGARFLEYIYITRVVREVVDLRFQVNTAYDEQECLSGLHRCRSRLVDWTTRIPPYLAPKRQGPLPMTRNNCPLHLTYYASQVLLFRALMFPASKAARADPNSNLWRWFNTAIHDMKKFVEFIDGITEGDLQSFWGRFARSQLILCGNFLIHLFIVASEPPDIKVAHDLLVSFHVSLQRLTSTEYYLGKLLVRPVALRVDSFFQQAGEIIRRGGHGYWQLSSLAVFRDNPVAPLDAMSED